MLRILLGAKHMALTYSQGAYIQMGEIDNKINTYVMSHEVSVRAEKKNKARQMNRK